ncbi:MAG: SDR family oxidoreductase [Acidobacteria bacterium]|nr:SDR family oxidoreductase [Acidobacteriota bacterium]
MFDFKGKTAIVTGGTRGIGLEVSRILFHAGADVVASYAKNREAAKELEGECPGVVTVAGDLGDEGAAVSLVDTAFDRFGSVDVLVNNAGIWNYLAAGSFRVDVWDHMVRNNLRSVYLVTDYLVSQWLKAGAKGRIVHVASTAGQRGEAEHAHYAATKGAIISYTKSLSSELAPKGIITNCVAPGWVDTEMNSEVFADGGKVAAAAGIPLGRVPTAKEIAWPIVFMASELASAITGEILNVNGGNVLCG